MVRIPPPSLPPWPLIFLFFCQFTSSVLSYLSKFPTMNFLFMNICEPEALHFRYGHWPPLFLRVFFVHSPSLPSHSSGAVGPGLHPPHPERPGAKPAGLPRHPPLQDQGRGAPGLCCWPKDKQFAINGSIFFPTIFPHIFFYHSTPQEFRPTTQTSFFECFLFCIEVVVRLA